MARTRWQMALFIVVLFGAGACEQSGAQSPDVPGRGRRHVDASPATGADGAAADTKGGQEPRSEKTRERERTPREEDAETAGKSADDDDLQDEADDSGVIDDEAPESAEEGEPLGRGVGLGVWDPATATFYLRARQSQGAPDFSVHYGASAWRPLVGDWDGDGVDSIGVVDTTSDPGAAVFMLRNSLTQGAPDHVVRFGGPAWVPLAGDWDGDGKDSIGIYEPATSTFRLRNRLSEGAPDETIEWGQNGDVPVVGNWDGKAGDDVGVFRPSTSEFFLRTEDGSKKRVSLELPPGAVPITGDWDGDGGSEIGCYDAATATFHLVTAGGGVKSVNYGAPTHVPLTGAWKAFDTR